MICERKELVGPQMINPTLFDQIRMMPGGEKLASCIQCGICSGSCMTPSAEFNPRLVIELVQIGLGDMALSTPSRNSMGKSTRSRSSTSRSSWAWDWG